MLTLTWNREASYNANKLNDRNEPKFSEQMSFYMATNNRCFDNLVETLEEEQAIAVHFSHAVEDTVDSHIHTLRALTANVVQTAL